MLRVLLFALSRFAVLSVALCASAHAAAAWPKEVERTAYASPADGTDQPMMAWFPRSDQPVPLLVALHTWSSDYQQVEDAYALWCIAKGWAFVHPDFRGPNRRPQAMGSELAVRDILAAVDEAKRRVAIDPARIYLMGGSGGGYASLLMAGRAPELWAGVSAWVPIVDLRDWHRECTAAKRAYAAMMEAACGGAPGASAEVDQQYTQRSASAWLAKAAGVPLDINTGIHDGHGNNSVPISQALHAFNLLASPAARLMEDDIAFMTAHAQIPAGLIDEAVDDPLYGRKPVLFRRVSGAVRITVFDGGHEFVHEAGLTWLERQRKSTPAVWDVNATGPAIIKRADTNVGK